ncbi:hypothetical protein IVA93_02905 [Bradyrhizobium sp. 155]|uniref:hypothetical protein n=1 Tax=Bradyrhizobium sp. 155 TaxID=2782629 RepID=UPI001FFE84BA|nr:hypothetical protein [Bradyrhizobium sp. 155]UPK12189.1 hypothetical protein IVA93_02905 [Bradyrhizobium sp. 155]
MTQLIVASVPSVAFACRFDFKTEALAEQTICIAQLWCSDQQNTPMKHQTGPPSSKFEIWERMC